MHTEQELIQSLNNRVAQFGAGHESRWLLESAAMAEAIALISLIDVENFATGEPGRQMSAASALSRFFLERFAAGGQADFADYMSALPLLVIQRIIDPHLDLPVELPYVADSLDEVAWFGSIREAWEGMASDNLASVVDGEKSAGVGVSVTLLKRLLASDGQGAAARARQLFNLAMALELNAQRTRSESDFGEAFLVFEQALSSTPQDDPSYPHRAAMRCTFNRHLYEINGSVALLDEAIQVYDDVLLKIPADNIDKTMHKVNYAQISLILFGIDGRTDPIDRSLVLIFGGKLANRRARRPTGEVDILLQVLLTVRFDPSRAGQWQIREVKRGLARLLQNNHSYLQRTLAKAQQIQTRWESSGDPADFARAVTMYAEAMTLPGADEEEGIIFGCIGQMITARFRQQRNEHLAELAVLMEMLAFERRRPGTRGELIYIFELAEALAWRYSILGNPQDLEDAITNLRQLRQTSLLGNKAEQRISELLALRRH